MMAIATQLRAARSGCIAGLLALLVACGGGGGGGGDRAPGVEPGPTNPGGAVTPPAPDIPVPVPSPYAEAEELIAFITLVNIPEDGRAVVDFQLADGNNTAIIDLGAGDVRFTLAKLQASPLGNLTGSWQSYINRIRDPDPEDGPGTEPRLQATYERDAGEFTNNGDGTYRYRFELNVTALPADILSQAASEGLNLEYQPQRTHRLVIQFSNSEGWANPVYNWVPETGTTEGLFTMDIAATENCNRCHGPLAFHGSGRREVEYCVTCHNTGSTDPSTENTVDMKVMIHKIHMGSELPSVQEGGSYVVGGRDYSGLNYPQDIRNCENCHAGTATGAGREDLVLTAQGDNWNEYPTRASCGSCHDLLDFEQHEGGQVDDSDCASCHSLGGDAGSVEESHRILSQEARETIAAEILSIANTGPGETPTVSFRVSNPESGEAYDIINDPIWTDRSSRLRVRFAWDTSDYQNTGNQEDNASSVAADAKEDAVPNGDGSYSINSPIPIPDHNAYPGIAATGSGTAVIEGRAVMELEPGEDPERVSLTNVHQYFSIDEPDGRPTPRREDFDGQVVELEKCLSCHSTLAFHGGSRADNIESCVTCHNPRNTDLEDRLELETPPVDGLKEQVVDMKVMIHGIHASEFRQIPLQIADQVFGPEQVRYPGRLANCSTCHAQDTYMLPLQGGVLGPTVDSGDDLQDPRDDIVASPEAAVCASCHDDKVAKSHMESNGGSFATSQAAIDNDEVVEQCTICHAPGKAADVAEVHGLR
jgi:OmcA/MtrC family decaheme c-type cytochrome